MLRKRSGKIGVCMTMSLRSYQKSSVKILNNLIHQGHQFLGIQWVAMVRWPFTWKTLKNIRYSVDLILNSRISRILDLIFQHSSFSLFDTLFRQFLLLHLSPIPQTAHGARRPFQTIWAAINLTGRWDPCNRPLGWFYNFENVNSVFLLFLISGFKRLSNSSQEYDATLLIEKCSKISTPILIDQVFIVFWLFLSVCYLYQLLLFFFYWVVQVFMINMFTVNMCSDR